MLDEARTYLAVLALWNVATYRWEGNENNLRPAWRMTMGEDMPFAPLVSFPWEGKTFEIYKSPAPTVDDEEPGKLIYSGDAILQARCVVRWPDGHVRVHAIDLDSRGKSLTIVAALAIIEHAAEQLGVNLRVPRAQHADRVRLIV